MRFFFIVTVSDETKWNRVEPKSGSSLASLAN